MTGNGGHWRVDLIKNLADGAAKSQSEWGWVQRVGMQRPRVGQAGADRRARLGEAVPGPVFDGGGPEEQAIKPQGRH